MHDGGWPSLNVLAELEEYRERIENHAALLGEHVTQASIVANLFSGASFTYISRISATDFSEWLGSTGSSASFQSNCLCEGTCAARSVGRTSVAQYRCCWSRGSLVEQETLFGGVVLVSMRCRICGATADARDLEYLIEALADPLIVLAGIVLSEALYRCRDLLRLVIAAIAVLLAQLRRAAVRNEIAIGQRSFFTHHGAHPPRSRFLAESGLLRGRVFQLKPAV